jgi:hypothetical protein
MKEKLPVEFLYLDNVQQAISFGKIPGWADITHDKRITNILGLED